MNPHPEPSSSRTDVDKKPCLKSPVLFLECGRLWLYGVYYGLAMKIKGILRFCLFAYMKTKAHMSV